MGEAWCPTEGWKEEEIAAGEDHEVEDEAEMGVLEVQSQNQCGLGAGGDGSMCVSK